MATYKHKANILGDTKISINIFTCDFCKKKYNSRNGLWKHKKSCNINENIVVVQDASANEIKVLTTLVLEIVKSNTELQKQSQEVMKSNTELQKQNHDLQKQVLDVCKNIQPSSSITNSNNTNINSHNKTFNLQFFLNEQCKDAMNINDFVDTFKLHFNDLEQVGKVGYVEGISDIIIKRLNAMDIYKRPIHCSDAKRDTLFVKDMNIWEKDNETNDKLRNAIKCITKKNSDMLTQWSDTHPQSRNSNSPMNNTYMSLILQAMGGKGELVDNENRIIRKISKTVLIDEGHKNVHVK